jgi:arylsulfatase A-like enzyme
LQNAVQIADTALQQGQGMHGSFGRDNTFNFMAATGPDFRAMYRDPMPASNADIAPTLLRLLGLPSRPHGVLAGRVLEEALQGHAVPAGTSEHCLAISGAAADGRRTVLEYQRYRGRVYLDQAALRVVLQQERTGCRRP